MLDFIKKYRVLLTSFLLAVVIWFLVVIENQFEYVIKIPIVSTNLMSNTVISSELPKNARIRVRARGRSLLRLLLFREAKLLVDLHREVGRQVLSLSSENILLRSSPDDVKVLELISPDTVTVVIEHLKKKMIPVISDISIKTVPGYTIVGNITLNPDSVSIEGPASRIENYHSITTKNKTFEKIKFPIEEEVELNRPSDKRVRLLITKVAIHADIQKLMEKSLSGIPVEIRGVPANMKAIVIPSHLSITLEGGVNLLTEITKDDVVAYVDLRKEWTTREQGHPAYIETPNGVRYRDVKPKYFKVVLEKINN